MKLRYVPSTILKSFLIILIFVLFQTTYSQEQSKSNNSKSEKSAKKGPIPPPRRDVPGKRIKLPLGQLYVPDFFDPSSKETIDLMIFFHGAAWCAEQNFYDAKKNAVLVSIHLKEMPEIFPKAEDFSNLVESVKTTLAQEKITTKPIKRICLASFSGGYVAPQQILKYKEFKDLITDVVLADSLYTARTKDDPNKIVTEPLKPFLDYAQNAALGKCTFLYSHLYPPEEKYRNNKTTLTAAYLIEEIGAKRSYPENEFNTRGEKLLYRADKGNFHIFGYDGMTTQDHFEHLYSVSDLFKQISFSSVEDISKDNESQ